MGSQTPLRQRGVTAYQGEPVMTVGQQKQLSQKLPNTASVTHADSCPTDATHPDRRNLVTLTKAIDDLLEYVEPHWQTPNDVYWEDEFYTLDIQVYMAAQELGLPDTALPRRDGTFPAGDITFY